MRRRRVHHPYPKGGYQPNKRLDASVQQRRALKALINGQKETKVSCIAVGGTGVGTTGHFDELTPLAQGNTDSTRLGDEVDPHKLTIRGYIQAEDGDTFNLMRLMVVKAKQGNAVASGDMPANALTCIRPEMKQKYSILFDHVYALNTKVSGFKWTKSLNMEFNLEKYGKLYYQNAATAGTGGGVYLWAVSDSAASAHPDIAYEAQFEYRE